METVTSPYTVKVKTYFIARSEDNSVIHNGDVDAGVKIETGQPILEVTEDEQAYLDRCEELGIQLSDDLQTI